jgi:hypothetical protein
MINRDSVKYLVGAKKDLIADYSIEWQRPKYGWQSSKHDMGAFTTDATHFYAFIKPNQCAVAGTNLTKILYDKKIIFEQAPVTNEFNFDGSMPDPGVWRVRSWQGKMRLEN